MVEHSSRRRPLLESLRAFTQGGVLSLVRLGAGFGKTKYIALALGPTGVGILSQGNQLSAATVSLGSLCMAVGIISGLASADGDEDRARRILGTALAVQVALSTLITVFGIGLARPLAMVMFGANEPLWSITAISAAPLAVGASGVLEGVLFGSNRYDLYVRASVVATLLGLGAQIALIRCFALTGAFIAYPVNSAILFACFLFQVRRFRPLRDTFVLAWDTKELVRLLKFSGSMTLNAFATYAVALFVRRAVIVQLGADGNGIVQVPIALTAYYTPFVTNGLWGRLYPYVSARGDTAEARVELNQALQIASLLTLAYTMGVTVLRPLLVAIAYSAQFKASLPLIPLQAAGDYAYFTAFTLSVHLLATHRLTPYLVGWLAYYGLYCLLATLLLPRLGLSALPVAHLLASGFTATAGLCLFVGAGRLSGRSLQVILVGSLLVGWETWSAVRQNLPAQIAIAAVTLLVAALWWRSARASRPTDP